MTKKDRIIFKVSFDIKKEFKECCEVVGLDMTTVLLSKMVEFIKESKETPKK